MSGPTAPIGSARNEALLEGQHAQKPHPNSATPRAADARAHGARPAAKSAIRARVEPCLRPPEERAIGLFIRTIGFGTRRKAKLTLRQSGLQFRCLMLHERCAARDRCAWKSAEAAERPKNIAEKRQIGPFRVTPFGGNPRNHEKSRCRKSWLLRVSSSLWSGCVRAPSAGQLAREHGRAVARKPGGDKRSIERPKPTTRQNHGNAGGERRHGTLPRYSPERCRKRRQRWDRHAVAVL